MMVIWRLHGVCYFNHLSKTTNNERIHSYLYQQDVESIHRAAYWWGHG